MHEAEVHYDAILIQGPRQPGNDIDVYLRPLVEEQEAHKLLHILQSLLLLKNPNHSNRLPEKQTQHLEIIIPIVALSTET